METFNLLTLSKKIYEARMAKKQLEDKLKKLEIDLKKQLNENKIEDATFGNIRVILTHVSATMICDGDKLKKDGLFEKYSKVKNGYDKLELAMV
jgi:hypothetical protein